MKTQFNRYVAVNPTYKSGFLLKIPHPAPTDGPNVNLGAF